MEYPPNKGFNLTHTKGLVNENDLQGYNVNIKPESVEKQVKPRALDSLI